MLHLLSPRKTRSESEHTEAAVQALEKDYKKWTSKCKRQLADVLERVSCADDDEEFVIVELPVRKRRIWTRNEENPVDTVEEATSADSCLIRILSAILDVFPGSSATHAEEAICEEQSTKKGDLHRTQCSSNKGSKSLPISARAAIEGAQAAPSTALPAANASTVRLCIPGRLFKVIKEKVARDSNRGSQEQEEEHKPENILVAIGRALQEAGLTIQDIGLVLQGLGELLPSVSS